MTDKTYATRLGGVPVIAFPRSIFSESGNLLRKEIKWLRLSGDVPLDFCVRSGAIRRGCFLPATTRCIELLDQMSRRWRIACAAGLRLDEMTKDPLVRRARVREYANAILQASEALEQLEALAI